MDTKKIEKAKLSHASEVKSNLNLLKESIADLRIDIQNVLIEKDHTISQQKDYIKILEERLAQINAICDKEGIPKRMKVEGGLTAGIQTQARVEMLVEAYKNKLHR